MNAFFISLFAKRVRTGAIALAIATVPLLLAGNAANAAIRCDGPFQLIKGHGKMATNYCEDQYLTSIARSSYGLKVAFQQVRNNPNLKARVCRQIGHDSRLIGICSNYRSDGRDDWPM